MKLKFNKVIVFIIAICMMVISFIGCRSKNDEDVTIEIIETTETVEETEIVETTNFTEIKTEVTQPTEYVADKYVDDKNNKPNNNNNYSSGSNNMHDEDNTVDNPKYNPEQEKNDNMDEEIPDESYESNEEELENKEELEEDVDNEESDLIYMGNYKLTAYCACSRCCGKSDGITASGTVATQGRTIAVDPNVIPYGTEVVINGNTYIAEDRGGAIYGNRIDIFFNNHQDALNFGVQYADVYIKK